ncbi:MAG: response regulator, partial [Alphaproteobacteria bacterium]|nr:response regulator [Alphaproteobacteria bacterium]
MTTTPDHQDQNERLVAFLPRSRARPPGICCQQAVKLSATKRVRRRAKARDDMERLREQVFTANVLVVDDVLANVELLRMALTRAGYKKITAVQDPREVVDLDKQIGFDMVLLDLQMPHMDGFQVMEYLRSNHPGELLPILILTAQIDRPTRLKALRAGATDFVTKPFDVDELMNRVGNLVEMRLLYLERRDQAAILETKVRERTRELEEMRNEILRVLGRAGEYRDNETGAHVIRVAKSCGLLARALGQDVDWAEMLMNASPL